MCVSCLTPLPCHCGCDCAQYGQWYTNPREWHLESAPHEMSPLRPCGIHHRSPALLAKTRIDKKAPSSSSAADEADHDDALAKASKRKSNTELDEKERELRSNIPHHRISAAYKT